jgi:hypothetical protein
MEDKRNPPPPDGANRPSERYAALLAAFKELTKLKLPTAQPVVANTIHVDPGGATFPTISAALAAITDASRSKQYLLTAGPGTYNEQVTLKPYVYLHGSGMGQTIITHPPVASDNFLSRGTIVGASNSGIANLTASCLGGTWGDWSTALLVAACSPFLVGEAVLLCDDQGNAGINIETVAVNWNAQPIGPSQVYISYVTMTARMQSGDSDGTALMVNGPADVQCIESKMIATGGGQSFGANSNGGATLTLDNCVAQGATFALNIPDYHSTLIANNCTIDGPVANGVQINNYSPPVA